MEAERSPSNIHSPDALEQFITYPFESDEIYQQGLAGILSNAGLEDKPDVEKELFMLNSKVFYFNRITGLGLIVDDVRRYKETVQSTSPAETVLPVQGISSSIPVAGDAEPEPRILSFAELKSLIEQGKTDQIPNNRVIPEALNKENPSESKAEIRRKPWELANQSPAISDTQ